MFLSELIPLSESLAILKENQKIMETEVINLEDSYLRVLTKEIYSLHDSPPFDKSAMDGYAVKAEDTFGASANVVKNLKIIDQIGAGDFSTKEVKEGEAIKIATGAPIPKGANAVLMEEYTVSNKEDLEIHSQVTPNENVAFCGEDLKKGDKVLPSSLIIRPQEMGLIASSGFGEVEVYKKPRVKLIITGNELVEPSPHLKKAQTINSNKYTISAMIKSAGADVEIGHAQDDFDEVKEAIFNGAKDYDLVITTGGTAISKGDVVVDVVDDIGEVLIHGVALRPGKPVGFGIVNDTPIFMLSGYPVAAMGQFDALVRQYLFKMQNIDYAPKIEKRIATLKIFSNLGRTDYVRTFSDDKNTKYILNRGSGIIRSMVKANSYVIIDENQEGVAKGDLVDVLFFDNMNWNK
ncbi:MAG: molybdopterin molybdotransferase MoeA [Methanobrevibacter sp.]|nr:molybdopterin molybdotransferase MoeA [Methanobrevibacter sp.]